MLKQISLLLVGVLLVGGLPLFAQPADDALLERALTIIESVKSYESYAEASIETETQNFSISQDGELIQQLANTHKTIITRTWIDRTNNAALRFISLEADEDGQVYSLEAEVRYVDETLYTTAAYSEGTGPDTFPAGWVVVEEADSGFISFDPQDLVDSVTGAGSNPFEEIDLIKRIVTGVSSSAGDWEGVPVEVISIEIGSAGILDLIAAQDETFDPDSEIAAIFSYMSADSGALLTLYVDEDAHPIHLEISMTINIVDLAINTIDPTAPPGFTASFVMGFTESASLSEINTMTKKISAP